ncbi:hypothetical protein BJ138DRAFT_1171378 [Hygrophoropsis aurantiaca]|uniref:Uncharacterized protein n=1 Tax=Hygrophoropsis aurantiaca TaxID=72124 RepID=A0ACB8AIK5_9AGAM|nr:hypothetical protein BJ138DRAFT_1171378 [Hygrophoropsis aurantiaca]
MQAIHRFRARAFKEIIPQTHSSSSSEKKIGKAPVTLMNPFVPRLSPLTGRWSPPKLSLRRQAVLVKKARQLNVLELLPPGPKLSAVEIAAAVHNPTKRPIVWHGKVKERSVPGADIGNRLYAGKKRMFKGHKWERVAEERAKRRNMLMRDMSKRIMRFKQFHKKRRPSPLKPPRTAKSPKLPF